MRSLQTHSVYSVLALATGLCLAACSKDEKTSLLVDVTLDKLVAGPPDQVTFAVSRGQTKFTNQQTDWSAASAGTLKVTLLLPAEAAGLVTLDVSALLRGNQSPIAAATPSPTTTIVAGKVNGPLAVTLTPFGGSGDGGVDALPGDGPGLVGGPEAGSPDAGVTPDARSDGPGPDAAVPDAPAPADVVQPTDVSRLPDVPQLADSADVGVDAAETTAPDAPAVSDVARLTDAVEAGADGIAGPAWQPAENIMTDPFANPAAIAVAVDPVKEHVYVMWIDYASGAVKVTRRNRTTAAWEPTRTLESLSNGDPQDPQIGVDGTGQVTAAWFHTNDQDPPDPTVSGVRVSRSTDGVSWSPAESVTPLRRVVELSLAVARDGRARIAFSEKLTATPYTVQLYSAYFDGKTWTTGPNPLAPEDPTDRDFRIPSVAISDTCTGIILFTQKDSTGYDSVAASTFAGATVDDFVLLDDNTTFSIDNVSYSTVAVNRSGQGAVVWPDTNGALLRSYSPTTGTWTAAEKIGNVGLNYPSMVMAPDGTITLAWQEGGSSYFNVWAIEGRVGGPWTTTPLETDNLAIGGVGYWGYYETLPFPSLAVDAVGNVLAFWRKKTQITPLEFAVYGRRKLAGKPNGVWQPATSLASESQIQPYRTSLAVSDQGLGAAAYYWEDPNADPNTPINPDSNQIFVSLFR
jgi:hypothetical protein